ncbi:MAG: hypothetical protein K2L25_01665 [Alphaproteobacteria bacterium]|nr:hypothetical protein [Alphaproteobacteria bacterium]
MLSETKFITTSITDNSHNYKETQSMDISKPCILILGGENTNSDSVASSYFRSIKETLKNNRITSNLNLYSACYDFGQRDSKLDRFSLFYQFRTPKQLADINAAYLLSDLSLYPFYNIEPQYINNIYQVALQPRLYAKNGEILPPETIEKNLRNMVIFAHCHGAYVARMLEQKMLQDTNLQKLLSQKPKLLQNMLVINHAPFAPLENYQFTSLSFCSASDTQAGLYTKLDSQIKSAPNECAPAFFGSEFGNIMIADRLKRDINDEHSHIGLRGSHFTDAKLTPSGKILFSIERNALLKGVDAMIKGKAIPTIPQMLSTQYASYQELKRRGMQIYRHFHNR